MVVFVVTVIPTAADAAAVTATIATTTTATAVVATDFFATAPAAVGATTAMDGWLLPELCLCVAPHAHKEPKAY